MCNLSLRIRFKKNPPLYHKSSMRCSSIRPSQNTPTTKAGKNMWRYFFQTLQDLTSILRTKLQLTSRQDLLQWKLTITKGKIFSSQFLDSSAVFFLKPALLVTNQVVFRSPLGRRTTVIIGIAYSNPKPLVRRTQMKKMHSLMKKPRKLVDDWIISS